MHAAMRRVAGLAAVLALLAFPGVAFAAPANDNPENAAALTVSASAGDFDSITSDTATTYTGEPMTASDVTDGHCQADGSQVQDPGASGSQMTKTAWWRFTGTGGRATVSSYFSNFDTVLAVWTFESDNLFHFVKCSDDVDLSAPGIDLTSELFFNTTAGKTYYVQVGGCDGCTFGGEPTDEFGTLGLDVSPPPSNDSRGNAQTVNLGQNVARATDGAQGDGESVLNCGSRTYGKTVWYRFVVTQAGTATIDASGFDSAASLYAGSSASPFDCGVSPADGATSISRRLGPGVYLAQVGGQGSGVGAARGNLNFKVSFVPDGGGGGGGGGGGTPPDPDSDGDGLVDSQDCADNDPKRRQGFKEIVGNSRDEDCDGAAQDFTEVRARRGPADYSAAARTRLSTLFVNRISAGDKVTFTCKGKGCGRKRYVKRFGKARAKYNFAKAMRRNRPGRGAVLEVRVTHAQRIGHVWRYKFRFYKNPTVQEDLCLRPGAKTPKRCP